MNIDFSVYDFTSFDRKEGVFCGQSAILITPKPEVKFNQKNKIFRSSIWSPEGELLSGGLPKFNNWGESPDEFPPPESLEGCQLVTKMDGSLFCADFHNGELNARTRDTFNYKTLGNSQDFEFVLKKYPLIGEWLAAHRNFTLLCEILSPNQIIILRYGPEPDLRLIGCVNKKDYSLLTQEALDNLSEFVGIPRPAYRQLGEFNSFISEIQALKGTEGFCCYSNGGQTIHKIKTVQYVTLHRAKSAIASFDKVLDVFFEIGRPSYEEFYSYIETTFDYELAEYGKEHIAACCHLYEKFQKELSDLAPQVEKWKAMDRKEVVPEIKSHQMNFYIFQIMNGKEIQERHIKKYILNL